MNRRSVNATHITERALSRRLAVNGWQVFVAFDSDTDQARIKGRHLRSWPPSWMLHRMRSQYKSDAGAAGSFACSRLFGFAKAYEATCVWANSTTVSQPLAPSS